MQAVASIGDYVVPDGWYLGGLLQAGDAPVDASYQGAQFRIQTGQELIPTLPVNITLTGRVLNYQKFSAPALRCRIEWVKDGEPSDSSHGWIVLHSLGRS